ncbi:MAG: prepilin-type N-terminal cleavage/methylation domain-containing protein [Desulfuromonadaceae bacterium]
MSASRHYRHKSAPARVKGSGSVAGYSLIELLTVIAIIGILATIAIPTYHGYRDKARMSTIYAALRQVKLAQEVYFTDHGKYFGIEEEVIEGPTSKEIIGLDVEIHIPNQQRWTISSQTTTEEEATSENPPNYYQVFIDTNMDRNQDGNIDQYVYYKKADAGGSTIEESDSFPLVPVAVD